MYSTLQFLVAQMNHRGFDTVDFTQGAGVSESELNDPWPFLPQEKYSALVDNIFRLCNEPSIGLTLSNQFQAYHLGAPGFAAITSATFAEARQMIMRYRVLKDPYLYLLHQFTGDEWRINFRGAYPTSERVERFSIEGHAVRTARFCRELTGSHNVINSIHFSYKQPTYVDKYLEILDCPVSFDEKENSIELNPLLLQQALPSANARVFALCKQECDSQLLRMDKQHSLTNKVHQELFRGHTDNNNTFLDLIDVATRLHISPRTLRRKLAAEDTSFKVIVSDVRRDLACHYLKSMGLPIKEVSYCLGYSSTNNFHRAFKQWTGKTVSEFLVSS